MTTLWNTVIILLVTVLVIGSLIAGVSEISKSFHLKGKDRRSTFILGLIWLGFFCTFLMSFVFAWILVNAKWQ